MKKTVLLAAATAIVVLAAGAVLADYPLTGGGVIFSHAQGVPDGPVLTGPGKVSVFNATPAYGNLYLWINGVQLFNRPGYVFENAPFSTDWLTAAPQRKKIWNWSLPGKVTGVVVAHNLKEADQGGASLDVAAITSFSKAVVVARRQISLEAANMPHLGSEIVIEHPDFPVGALPSFLRAFGQAKVSSRIDAVIYIPLPDRKWGNGSKAIYVEPFDAQIELPEGIKARRQAIIKLSADQERRLSDRVREILDKIVRTKEESR